MSTRTRILLGIAGAAILLLTFLWSGRPGILNHEWTLSAIDGKAVVPGVEVTAEFERQPFGRIRGNSGCNTYRASYTRRGAAIQVEDPVRTDAGCPTPEMTEQERTYFALLAEATGYTVEGDTLTLTTDDGHTLIFTARGGNP